MNKLKLRKNKKGGIEGLPLQLLIIIVVASLGLTMMVGWMNNIEEPTTIDRVEVTVSPTSNVQSKEYLFDITVYDNKGNPIDDADIVITGLGVSDKKPTKTTNWVALNGVKASLDLIGKGINNVIDWVSGDDDNDGEQQQTVIVVPAPTIVEPEVPEETIQEDEPEVIVQPEVVEPKETIQLDVIENEKEEDQELTYLRTYTAGVAGKGVHMKTDSNGSASDKIYLTGIDWNGYLNIEVSKAGYGTYTTSIMVTEA